MTLEGWKISLNTCEKFYVVIGSNLLELSIAPVRIEQQNYMINGTISVW